MKIMILGADGYLGWPMSANLSLTKHKLVMIDNYVKRSLFKKYGKTPLINYPKIDKRLKLLKKYNKNIKFYNLDCTDSQKFSDLFKKYKPDVVIHFAELPSAPYSMYGPKEGWVTLDNNLKSTFNLIEAVKKYNKKCHIIKLGTMGEYGTPNINIEEGWLTVKHKDRQQKFLYPRQGSSLYHTSKIMDTDLLWFYVRTSDLRVTDLMQGPVYGIRIGKEFEKEEFYPTFAYDDMFGTVLNRFIVQAIAKIPLTVYGSGNQIRGYLDIKDTLQCINLAIKNPPNPGDLKIYNQFTEQFSVNQLAKKVKSALKKINIETVIKKIKNPRIEKEKHYYNAMHNGMKKLGLKPTLLTDKSIIEIAEYVFKYKKQINKKIIQPKSIWK
tara:strand:+ start:149 stop:1294 length:1146 start_codon:yes stop_codon:yes gene_type:complete